MQQTGKILIKHVEVITMEKRNIMEQFQNQIETWVEQDKERIITLFSKLVRCETPSDS